MKKTITLLLVFSSGILVGHILDGAYPNKSELTIDVDYPIRIDPSPSSPLPADRTTLRIFQYTSGMDAVSISRPPEDKTQIRFISLNNGKLLISAEVISDSSNLR